MMRKILASFAAAMLAAACVAAPTMAAPAAGSSYTLTGAASYVSPGHNSNRAVQLTSNSASSPNYSGIDFAVPSGLTFSAITNLSTDYNFTHNSCAGGSPRFQINVDGKNAFVYIGPPPNYTSCPMNTWLNTGNLVSPTSFVDTSQLPGGTFYDTFASADAKYGTHAVTGIQLVADGGWKFGDHVQTVLVDNVMINNTTYTFEPTSKEACKHGGWRTFTYPPGPFKNQGACVSYFASGGRH